MEDDLTTKYYARLVRAMQRGIDQKAAVDGGQEVSTRQLRVDLNIAVCDLAGIIALLITKGVITTAEFEATSAHAMADEVATYEHWLAQQHAAPRTPRC